MVGARVIELLHRRNVEQYCTLFLTSPSPVIRERVLLIKGMKAGEYTNLTVMYIVAHVICYFLQARGTQRHPPTNAGQTHEHEKCHVSHGSECNAAVRPLRVKTCESSF